MENNNELNYSDLWNKPFSPMSPWPDPTKLLRLPVRLVSPSEAENKVLRISNDFIEKIEPAKDENDSSVVGIATVNRNYFVPKAEDLYIGYECEIQVYPEYGEMFWEKHIIGEQYISAESLRKRIAVMLPFPEILRTPYLTIEQIEAEGWEHVGGQLTSIGFQYFKKHTGTYDPEDDNTGTEYRLTFSNHPHPHISIESGTISFGEAYYPYEGHNNIYSGDCPSINEFRPICKLLHICQ